VDISWWKNSAGSYFAWNYETDYFAGYNHGKEAGVAYVANHHIAPGMKFFTWGHDEAARMWDHILTDTDGPYLELMAGAWSDNQPDYSWIQPYESKQVTQYWFPIRQLEGMKYANLNGALNLSLTSEGTAQVRVNTTSRHSGARVVLTVSDVDHFDKVIEIDPATPFKTDLPVPRGTRETDLQISLYGGDGKLLMRYAPQPKQNPPRPDPVTPPPAPEEIQTVEELYLTGLRLDQFYNPSRDPLRYYQEALRRDPGNYLVNTQLGILSCRDKNWEEAEKYLRTALDRITANYTMPRDGTSFYYLGLALKAQGELDAAYDELYKATWSQALHSAAYFSLAEIDCRRGDLDTALAHLERSITTNTGNLKSLSLRAVVLRHLGRNEEAIKQVQDILAASPMDYQSRNELAILQSAMKAQQTRQELIRLMRGDAQIYLNLAVDYGNAGFYDEAIAVLERLVNVPKAEGSQYPLVFYYLGFYSSLDGNEDASQRYYQRAATLPSDYCFPFRPESIDVLQQASAVNPGDAMAHYYLGNLFFDSMPKRAQSEWEKARSIDDGIALVHRNLALAYEQVERDIAKATASMERAIECDPSNPRLFYEMDVLYEKNRTPVSERLALVRAHEDVIARRTDALTRKVLVNVQAGAFDEALETLTRYQFSRWEGGGQSVRALYQDSCLLRGIQQYREGRHEQALDSFKAALDLPQHMQMSGRGRNLRQAQILYYIGHAYEHNGDGEKANEYFQRAAEVEIRRSGYRPSPPVEHLFYQGLAWRKLGNTAESDRVFNQLVELASGKQVDRLGRRRESDFFAKFSEEGLLNVEEAEQEYRSGLASFVKGSTAEAEQHLQKALENDPNHYWARAHLESIETDLHAVKP
jgi:tetratricopeptide (TPR) repeat protein